MDIDGTIASAVAFAVTRLFAVYDSRIKPGPLAVPDASTLTGNRWHGQIPSSGLL